MAYAIGIDLGGTFIKAALVHQSRGLLCEAEHETGADAGAEEVLDRVAAAIESVRRQHDVRIEGVGVGAPGSVNWERTTVSHPPNFPGWGVRDVHQALEERLGLGVPVVVDNDANAAGLGSAFHGAGKAFPSFIMITLGTGVGGAIIYNKRLFRGATGGAGEIGHMTIDYEGPVARSGVAGAAEAYLGQRFLSRHAKMRLITRTDSVVHEMTGPDLEGITPKILHDAAVAGDEAAIEVLHWAGHKLGCLIGSAVNLLDLRKIVVGGGVSRAGEFLLEPARATMAKYITPGLRSDLEVVRETLGNEAGMLGAAHLVFDHLAALHTR
jgi:glucokinase